MALKKEESEKLKLKNKLQEYAASKAYKLNPNEKVTEGVINGLLRNKKFNGETYCPCRILTDNREEDKKIICPCIYHPGEIELQGHCKCSLFFRK